MPSIITACRSEYATADWTVRRNGYRRAPWDSSTSRSGSSSGSSPGLVGKQLFNVAWTKIDDEDPPKATTEQAPWAKIVGAAALQGVIFKVTRVVVDRYGAIGWRYLTGFWPGERRPDPTR